MGDRIRLGSSVVETVVTEVITSRRYWGDPEKGVEIDLPGRDRSRKSRVDKCDKVGKLVSGIDGVVAG